MGEIDHAVSAAGLLYLVDVEEAERWWVSERPCVAYGWHAQTRTVLTFDGDSDPDMTKVVPARIAAAMYASDFQVHVEEPGARTPALTGYSNPAVASVAHQVGNAAEHRSAGSPCRASRRNHLRKR